MHRAKRTGELHSNGIQEAETFDRDNLKNQFHINNLLIFKKQDWTNNQKQSNYFETTWKKTSMCGKKIMQGKLVLHPEHWYELLISRAHEEVMHSGL